tara:strand:+ start:625 stop:1017 length:393 start_codon:yes stop_codon:yes gene_type:complete
MKMTQVTSSNIAAIGYNPVALLLHVEFKSGKTFAYKYVSPIEYIDLLESDSVGKHFAQFIKHGREAVEVVKEIVETAEVDNKDVAALKLENHKLREHLIAIERMAMHSTVHKEIFKVAREALYNVRVIDA